MCDEQGHFVVNCTHYKEFMKLGWMVPKGNGSTRMKLKNNMKLPWKEPNGPPRYVLIERLAKQLGWDKVEAYFANTEEEYEEPVGSGRSST